MVLNDLTRVVQSTPIESTIGESNSDESLTLVFGQRVKRAIRLGVTSERYVKDRCFLSTKVEGICRIGRKVDQLDQL